MVTSAAAIVAINIISTAPGQNCRSVVPQAPVTPFCREFLTFAFLSERLAQSNLGGDDVQMSGTKFLLSDLQSLTKQRLCPASTATNRTLNRRGQL